MHVGHFRLRDDSYVWRVMGEHIHHICLVALQAPYVMCKDDKLRRVRCHWASRAAGRHRARGSRRCRRAGAAFGPRRPRQSGSSSSDVVIAWEVVLHACLSGRATLAAPRWHSGASSASCCHGRRPHGVVRVGACPHPGRSLGTGVHGRGFGLGRFWWLRPGRPSVCRRNADRR